MYSGAAFAGMRKLIESGDSVKIGQLASMLESDGIRTFVKNLNQSSLMGEVPFAEVFPELWIVDDAQWAEAQQLLASYQTAAPVSGSDWICPACGEEVPKEFGQCWNCNTAAAPAA
jgi:hypothetical protein